MTAVAAGLSAPMRSASLWMRLLVIEDEPKLAAFLQQGLEEQGWSVDLASDGPTGRDMALAMRYDVVILDLILPNLHGLDVCRAIRDEQRDTPILMLTALDTTGDKVRGLERGADDYLGKPFQFEELVARLRALARRSGRADTQRLIRYADLVVDCELRTARRGTTAIALTPREFDLLLVFMNNPGRTLSRTDLAERVWGVTFDTGTNVIDVYINYLRKKIDRDAPTRLIHTVYGRGYVLSEVAPS